MPASAMRCCIWASSSAVAVYLATSRASLAYSRLIFYFWAMRERKLLLSSGDSCAIR